LTTGEGGDTTEESTEARTTGETFGELLGEWAYGDGLTSSQLGFESTSELGVVGRGTRSRKRSGESGSGGSDEGKSEDDVRRVHFGGYEGVFS
jgi:hypothetical protein